MNDSRVIASLFIDPSRCIGCRACVHACSECSGHGGVSMIHLDAVEPSTSVQTAPTVCMHCEDPDCVSVCPADAIKIDENGVVLSALAERCIGCGNCALACGFGVPKIDEKKSLMQKCDLCYDRTSFGQAPMCATVCPSGALFYGTTEEIAALRRERPRSHFTFNAERVTTRNQILLPADAGSLAVGRPSAVRTNAELQLEEAIA
jgi:Fe-S-cluster-containing dehydrogenase component